MSKQKDVADVPQGDVQTSAQTTDTKPPKAAKPAHHEPTQLPARDQYSGKGGRYVRDPVTGIRKPAAE